MIRKIVLVGGALALLGNLFISLAVTGLTISNPEGIYLAEHCMSVDPNGRW